MERRSSEARAGVRGLAILFPALWAMLLGAEAHAQAQSPLRAHARVRLFVKTPDEPRLVAGTLLSFSRDTVTIVPRHAVFPVSFALEKLVRFQVNRGRPRALVYGAPLYGAALGAWFGATALAPDPACRAGGADASCHWETPPTIVGAAGGAVLLAMAVRLLVPEVWRDVPLTAFRGVAGASGTRIGLALRVR